MQNLIETLHVALDERSYPIHIGSGLLDRPELILPHIKQKRVVVVTNETVAPLYLARLSSTLSTGGVEVLPVVLPDGEQFKTWETLNRIFDALLGARCERSTILIALGGGVIGDMGGFAAACYQRGMPFIQVPTTLLSQVDSSVGGKTAINHPLGKNMIGAFYQPKLVLADIATLDTLPDRELKAGLAEVIKYGLIRDPEFFVWLEINLDKLLARDQASLIHAVHRSCTNKAEVVAADERESGERALLNLGHTFGHAIETGMGYGEWLHGEAVAAGTLIAAELSCRLEWIDVDMVVRIERLFVRAGLAEVIKYGLIRDPEFFVWLEINLDKLLARDQASLIHAVHRSCTNKAEVVAADERESGERALLNLGHTFGHAIETGMGYGEWLHGEAVAAGTLIAAELSCRLGWIDVDMVARIERLFVRAGLPVMAPRLGAARYLELMSHDKKVQDGKLRLVLLRGLGQAVVSDVATDEQIVAAIEVRCTKMGSF